MRTFTEAKEHSDNLRGSDEYVNRKIMFDEIENIFTFNETSGLPQDSHILETLDTDPHNALSGAARLIGSTDPRFTVPRENNRKDTGDESDKLERYAASIWQAAGRVSGRPRHYEMAMSGLLYSEVCVLVLDTSDIVDANPGDKRAVEVNRKAPLLFDIINPGQVYPEYDTMGLASVHIRQEKTAGDIRSRFGNKADAATSGKKDTDKVTVNEYWDYDNHYAWIEGGNENILPTNVNEWGFIPMVCSVMEGTSLLTRKAQEKRQPFLYADWKSKMHKRRNMLLTVQYSNIFALGANPQFIYSSNDTTKDSPIVDYTVPGGLIKLAPGEGYSQLAKQAVDPSLLQGYDLAERKGTESTMYRQALGESPTTATAFSTVSLLSQSGRLPLVMYQRMLSDAVGKCMEIGFRMLQMKGNEVRVRGSQSTYIFDITEIPEDVNIEANLSIDLPQDERNNAVIAMQVTSGDDPLLSKETAREKWMGIEQATEEQRRIWVEKASFNFYMSMVQEELQKQARAAQAQTQMMMQNAQQPNANGMQQGNQLPPEAMPPDIQQTGAMPGISGIPMGAPAEPINQQNPME